MKTTKTLNELDDKERWAVINALNVAAEIYLRDAINARNNLLGLHHRLAQQFLGQAAEAQRLRKLFEEAE
jgi:hypothetical protein